MKNQLIFLFPLFVFIFSCSDENSPDPNAPTVTDLSPSIGLYGTEVVIGGTNFNENPDENTVFFGDTQAIILEATVSQLVVVAPKGGETGVVTITTDGMTAVSSEFTYQDIEVSTVAGSTAGYVDGISEVALFDSPNGLAIDAEGSIFVADRGNNRIRKITNEETVTTYAGNGAFEWKDGELLEAGFIRPSNLLFRNNGDLLVIGNTNIRNIDGQGQVTTIAGTNALGYVDGTGDEVRFDFVSSAIITDEGDLIVTDLGNHVLRKVSFEGVVTTYAGSGEISTIDGTLETASFDRPWGITADDEGNYYVAEVSGAIRKINADGQVVTLVPGGEEDIDGILGEAQFDLGVHDIHFDNGYLIVSASTSIRRISPKGFVSTMTGSEEVGNVNGSGDIARFNQPFGMKISSNNIFLAGRFNNAIRKITIN